MWKKIQRNNMCWCNSGAKYKNCHLKIDEKLKSYKLKGISVPNNHQLLNAIQIEGIRESGRMNTHLLNFIGGHIYPGMSTLEIDDLVSNEISRLGAKSATLNYNGYPNSLCTSINNQVCHGIPSSNTVLAEGDIINIDIATNLNGYYSDSARVFPVGQISLERQKLLEVSRECVEIGLSSIVPWQSMKSIGKNISEFAEAKGYSVVNAIGGHGIGLKLHQDPFVSYSKKGTDILLVPGMVFTIEPAVNIGSSEVYEDNGNGWTIYTLDGSDSAQWEVTVVVNQDGYEVLAR